MTGEAQRGASQQKGGSRGFAGSTAGTFVPGPVVWAPEASGTLPAVLRRGLRGGRLVLEETLDCFFE